MPLAQQHKVGTLMHTWLYLAYQYAACLFAAAPGGFECRLTGAGGAAWPPPLHGWAACASPAAAAGLSDGSYIFSVRAAGTPFMG